MNTKDTKQLLTGILNDDEATVKKIVTAYLESCMSVELENASKAVMESISNEGKALYGN
jgi:ATP-dependent Clp protease adapter protein ClpS